MVTRVLELIPIAGKSDLLGRVVEGRVRSLLTTAPGFVEQAMLVSKGEPSLMVLLSVWKSRRSAERYDRKLLPQICDMTQRLREALPREKAFRVNDA